MFSFGKSTGPLLGMLVGLMFASLAVVINVVRYWQGGHEKARA
jgi:hypothetical protein